MEREEVGLQGGHRQEAGAAITGGRPGVYARRTSKASRGHGRSREGREVSEHITHRPDQAWTKFSLKCHFLYSANRATSNSPLNCRPLS